MTSIRVLSVSLLTGLVYFLAFPTASNNDNLLRARMLSVDEDALMRSQLGSVQDDFELARGQSYGFFDNIRSEDWKMLKQRARENVPFWTNGNIKKKMTEREIRIWYMINAEPDFTCLHERRIGGYIGALGDGAKWVCDTHRIAPQVKYRKEIGGNGCLIYSVGSHGNFDFELGMQQQLARSGETCEIHVFDVVDYSGVTPPNVFFHHWGFKGSKAVTQKFNADMPLKTFQETVHILGHIGSTVDVFKIDCEGCEWDTYTDWIEAPVTLNQILVEVHFTPKINFFEALHNAGYVTFHKEANLAGSGQCVEYAFLKLAPEFFN